MSKILIGLYDIGAEGFDVETVIDDVLVCVGDVVDVR